MSNTEDGKNRTELSLYLKEYIEELSTIMYGKQESIEDNINECRALICKLQEDLKAIKSKRSLVDVIKKMVPTIAGIKIFIKRLSYYNYDDVIKVVWIETRMWETVTNNGNVNLCPAREYYRQVVKDLFKEYGIKEPTIYNLSRFRREVSYDKPFLKKSKLNEIIKEQRQLFELSNGASGSDKRPRLGFYN